MKNRHDSSVRVVEVTPSRSTLEDHAVTTGRRRVFHVDHFPISRMAVSEWLKQTPDLLLCGEADNATNALAAIGRLEPEIVVTEIFRQQDLGFIRSLHHQYPSLPILVFSFRDEEWYAPGALEAGADGYLMKGIAPTELIEAIRATLEGRVVLSSKMRAQLFRGRFRRRRTEGGEHR